MSYKEWPDIDVLEDYLDGKLDAKTMHEIEKISLDDAFVADALAGLSQSPRRQQNLSLLQRQLQQRIAQKPIVQKRWRITSQRLSIASAAAVLCISVSVLFWMKQSKRQELLAKSTKKVEVSLASPNVKKVAQTQILAQPATGWNAYQQYLKDNNRLIKNVSIGQYVELAFKVDQQGFPDQIKVLKSLGKRYDNEATRLLKEGPKWRTTVNQFNHGKLKIQF